MAEPALHPKDFVKKVGRGKTLSQDLTSDESRAAFAALLDGTFTPAQAGAFLQALRIKELTQDELDGLLAVLYARLRPQPALAGARGLALNLASDTGRKGGLLSLLAARLLPRFGVGVGVIRSAPVISGNWKSFDDTWALCDSLEARFAREAAVTALPADPAAQSSFQKIPIVACSDLIPGFSALDVLRGELGFRSCLHTAEKMLNPWPAAPLLLGISHKHYALRLAEAMRKLGLRGKIVLGNHGTVDLVLHKETELIAVDADGIREESVSPAALGLAPAADIYSLAKFGEWRAWVGGPRDGAFWQALCYHVAVWLWAAGAAATPGDALAQVQRGLGSAV